MQRTGRSSKRAVILFAHGARDPNWSTPLYQLVDLVGRRLPDAHVAAAFLELQEPTLDEAMSAARNEGCAEIDVVPVFWAAGGHVANDLPRALEAFRVANPQVTLRLLPTLSELPGLLDFIADAVSASAPSRSAD